MIEVIIARFAVRSGRRRALEATLEQAAKKEGALLDDIMPPAPDKIFREPLAQLAQPIQASSDRRRSKSEINQARSIRMHEYWESKRAKGETGRGGHKKKK